MTVSRPIWLVLALFVAGCAAEGPRRQVMQQASIRIGGQDVPVRERHVADLVVTSGTVIACDVLTYYGQLEFTVPPGTYPVVLSRVLVPDDEERNAFVMLRVSDEKPVKWEWAQHRSEPGTNIANIEPPVFAVDSWHAGFMDLDAMRAMNAQPDNDNALAEEHAANEGSWNVHRFPGTRANVVSFFSGLGSGVYPVRVGRDADGRVARVVVDFRIADEGSPLPYD